MESLPARWFENVLVLYSSVPTFPMPKYAIFLVQNMRNLTQAGKVIMQHNVKPNQSDTHSREREYACTTTTVCGTFTSNIMHRDFNCAPVLPHKIRFCLAIESDIFHIFYIRRETK